MTQRFVSWNLTQESAEFVMVTLRALTKDPKVLALALAALQGMPGGDVKPQTLARELEQLVGAIFAAHCLDCEDCRQYAAEQKAKMH